jgi:ribosomal protein S18 acetylase RimI-like enzyme
MPYRSRSLNGEQDLRAMESFARKFHAENLRVFDLPYCLSSWALEDPQNARLWEDEKGDLLAWAVLQFPSGSLDYVCDPEHESHLLPEILTWMDAWSRQHPGKVPLGTPEDTACWFANVFSSQREQIRILEEFGFKCQADVGEYSLSKVLMERPGDLLVKEYRIPAGFCVRPLNGEAEAEAYVDLHRGTFGTLNMQVEWRKRTIRHPDHIADIDLVVAAPDGRLGAFCICWMKQVGAELVGQIEPLGCHPDFRRYALGRLALAEGIRRMQARGVSRILVETDNWRNTAFQLYESMGFKVIQDVLVYRKDY